MTKISGQNVENMTKYNENMTTLVQSIKDTFKKDEAGVSMTGGTTASTGAKMAKLTKLAKVPLWSKDMSLETFSKCFRPGVTF